MYVERFLKKGDRRLRRKLSQERMLEKQRRLFEQYLEEARNNTELINKIPADADQYGSLYRKLEQIYEPVIMELYSESYDAACDIAYIVHPLRDDLYFIFACCFALVLGVIAEISKLLTVAVLGLVLLMIVPVIIDKKLNLRLFSNRKLRLAAESKVVCEHLREQRLENGARLGRKEGVTVN